MLPAAALATDYYKTGHVHQYPEKTELVYSNFTARSDQLAQVLREDWDGKIVFFGLQGFIQWFLIDHWNRTFFNLPKELAVAKYHRLLKHTLGPEHAKTAHIEALHDLGFLPLQIKALPEGSRVNMRVPVMTIKNTMPEFYWLTNYIETALSAECWKPTTTATIAYQYRKLLERYATLTGTPIEFVQWQGHDFSMRGLSGLHDAAVSASGHLLSFTGTDTIPAILYLEDYYGADIEKELVGSSVPATEHSVMCMGGKESEIETFRRLINDVYPSGIVSIVSDTWNFWEVVTTMAARMKSEILARDGKVVFRPDSGDPVKVLAGYVYKSYPNTAAAIKDYWALCEGEDADGPQCEAVQVGDKFYEISFEYWPDGSCSGIKLGKELSAAEVKGAVECLWDVFGGTMNEKGFKVLDQHVGLIYGDSITLKRADAILERLAEKKFASGNVVFGIGSFTYQYKTRDTFGFAVKSTYGVVDEQPTTVFKDPITDSGTKRSAKGLLRVEKEGDDFVLHDQQTELQEDLGELVTVFHDGEASNFQSLSEIRGRLLNR